MYTVIRKRYLDGFVLTEPDVRRLHQLINDAARKAAHEEFRTNLYCRLANGTVLELGSIDEVLGLENSGQKSIVYFSMVVEPVVNSRGAETEDEDSPRQPSWLINIRFQRPDDWYPMSWSIQSEVRGNSRDWVVLTASELDDRARALRTISFSHYLQAPHTSLAILIICLLVGLSLLITFTPRPEPAYKAVEELYLAGKLTNPIEALIVIEKDRNLRPRSGSLVNYLLLFAALTAAATLGIPRLARILASSHVFCWGDYIGIYRRRRATAFVVWTVVVLGLAVGVLSTYIAKTLGI